MPQYVSETHSSLKRPLDQLQIDLVIWLAAFSPVKTVHGQSQSYWEQLPNLRHQKKHLDPWLNYKGLFCAVLERSVFYVPPSAALRFLLLSCFCCPEGNGEPGKESTCVWCVCRKTDRANIVITPEDIQNSAASQDGRQASSNLALTGKWYRRCSKHVVLPHVQYVPT